MLGSQANLHPFLTWNQYQEDIFLSDICQQMFPVCTIPYSLRGYETAKLAQDSTHRGN